MKKVYICALMTLLVFSSCNDWLSVDPKTSIPTDKQFQTEAGFKDALTGIYLKMGTHTLYAGDLTYAYLDELAGLYTNYPGYEGNSTTFEQSLVYDYENQFKQKKNAIYQGLYNIISNVNNLLYYVDERRDVLRTEHLYEVIKGEALGMRAFLHFDLLRLFGPVYKDAPTAKAIAYRTRHDKIPTSILPADEVVTLVLKDLEEAEALLKKADSNDFFTDVYAKGYKDKNQFLVNREYRMNLFAIKAMLARVYCYKGDADSKMLAVRYAKEVIEGQPNLKLYTNQTTANYNSIRYGEQIFGLYVDELGKLLDAHSMNMENAHVQQHFATSEANFNLFYEKSTVGNSDWRKNPEMFEVTTGSEPNAFCRKYNQKGLTKTTGDNTIPLIRLPEMYYIVAACESNVEASVEALNTVRFARGISYSDAITSIGYDEQDATSQESPDQTKRINEIMKEVRKEFFAEGHLFYFLKSYGYKTFYGCGVKEMTSKQYQVSLPDAEKIFGNNN